MKVLVTGDRHWKDKKMIKDVLSYLYGIDLIIAGDARGADRLTHEIAKEIGIPSKEYEARWEKHGKAAGPIRNKAMLDSKPNIVIAFHDNIKESKGTKNMMEQARKAGVPVYLYNHPKAGS